MPTKKGADLRPGDLLIYGGSADPVRLAEVIWTEPSPHAGLSLYFTTTTNSARKPLLPQEDYSVASPMPDASMRWDDDREAWIVAVGTDPSAEQETRVVVLVDGNQLNEPL